MAEFIRSEPFMEHALDAWGGAVYRLALAQTRCSADAQDITQDAFLSLLRSTVAFKDDEHLKAWLLHVAANRCREYHRSAWKQRVESIDGTRAFADRGVEDPELEALFEHPVWSELARLPEKLRIVVHLHYVEGYPTDAIADILGILPSTVRTRLHRARTRLRDALDAPTTTATEKGASHEAHFYR